MSTQQPPDTGIASSEDDPVSRRRARTPRACLRCQRRKLKCNTVRPCSACTKNNVNCESAVGSIWRPYPRWRKGMAEQTYTHTQLARNLSEDARPAIASKAHPEPLDTALKEPAAHAGFVEESSSTIGFVAEAFNYHHSDSPEPSRMSAFPGGNIVAESQKSRNAHSTTLGNSLSNRSQNIVDSVRPGPTKKPFCQPSFMRPLRVATAEILSTLPDLEVISLLVDTYFDRVHWFMLVFHQEPFREKIRQLYRNGEPQTPHDEDCFGFLCLLLCVVAIGLQYICPYRKRLLANLNIETEVLMKDLITTVRSVLLELVFLGTLETVQVCVLLGSFYLYHGEPRPAWPIIGCALRSAQAIGLHRKAHLKRQPNSQEDEILHRIKNEERQRCWWALFEIDRFCSMVYGYPLSMSAGDWDVDLIEPRKRSTPQIPVSNLKSQVSEVTLLFYKRHMSELSLLLGDVLKTLYLPRHDVVRLPNSDLRREQMQAIVTQISRLDDALKRWAANIEAVLNFANIQLNEPAYSSIEERHADIGGSGEVFRTHLLRMQALALKLAYENAVILIHRPLLSFRLSQSIQQEEGSGRLDEMAQERDPFRYSLEACREAALETARLGSHSLFQESLDNYAAAFMGMHLFTAGVSLCLMASYEPCTIHAHNAKLGIHQLLVMQAALKEKSILSSQGLEILQKLATLVFTKELQRMINIEDPEPQLDQLMRRSGRETELHDSLKALNDHETSSTVVEAGNASSSQEHNTTGRSNMSFSPYYAFAENTAMVEALLDLGQVLPQLTPTESHEQAFASQDETCFPVGSTDQEQAWIWGWEWFPEAEYSNT